MSEVIQAAEVPSQHKNLRGGKRPGAGRKPNYLKRLGIKAITAAECWPTLTSRNCGRAC